MRPPESTPRGLPLDAVWFLTRLKGFIILFARCPGPTYDVSTLSHRVVWILLAVAAVFGICDPAVAEPRRILVLHSFGQHFQPWSAVAEHFREELAKQSPYPIS